MPEMWWRIQIHREKARPRLLVVTDKIESVRRRKEWTREYLSSLPPLVEQVIGTKPKKQSRQASLEEFGFRW